MRINGLEYHVEAEGDGPSLLLLHGFTGSAASWDALVPLLRTQFRLIMPDLPGHGRSATPPSIERGAMAALIADMAELIARQAGGSAHVLGYSMGGRLALGLALAAPEQLRRLVVESGSPGLATEAERQARCASDEALAQQLEREGIEAFVAAWERLPLWASQRNLPPEVLARQRAQRLSNDPRGLALSLRAMGTGAQPSFWEALPQLRPPTLLISGAADAKFSALAAAMQARSPACRHQVIANAGHCPHLEQPQAFAAALRSFL